MLIKIDLSSQRHIKTPLHFLMPNITPLIPTSLPPCPKWCGGWRGLQFLSADPPSSHFSSAAAWAFHGLQFIKEIPICCSIGSSTGCSTDICSSTWSVSSSSSDLGVLSAISHYFFPSCLPVWHFLPFLKYVFTEAPPAWLLVSVVSYSGSLELLGNSCFQHRGAPDLFSPRPLLQPSHCQHLVVYTQCRSKLPYLP